jgi:hypothetical protein
VTKVEESLAQIQAIPDLSERALMLGGLISTLMKVKGVQPVIVGQTAFECYTNAENGQGILHLSIFAGKATPRINQEIFGDTLKGKGVLSEWKIADITVKIEEEFTCENRDLCRDFNTDYGIAKLAPAEDITAARLWAASSPRRDAKSREEAKLLIYCALAEAFAMDWEALQTLAGSPAIQADLMLATLRSEAQEELNAAILAEQQAAANG